MNIHALQLTRLPNVSIQLSARLAKTLLRDRPTGKETNERIDQAADDLAEQVELVSDGLIARMITISPEGLAAELAFDRAVDALWYTLEKHLAAALVFAHPGLAYLPDEVAKEIELDESRAIAEEASELADLVFGSLSVHDIVKASMFEQVESTQLVLRNIEQQELRPRLEAVVGERLLDTIEACQEQYEAMVDLRFRREQGQSINLRTLRRELRWALVEYVNAILTKYRRKKPETGAWVLAKLKPISTLRQILAQTPNEAAAEDALEDFVEFELGLDEGDESGDGEFALVGDEG